MSKHNVIRADGCSYVIDAESAERAAEIANAREISACDVEDALDLEMPAELQVGNGGADWLAEQCDERGIEYVRA